VSAAQAAFVNQLIRKLPMSAPGINPVTVIATDATELRTVFNADQLPGVLIAYVAGIKAAFAVAIAVAGMSFLFSLMSKWTRLNVDAGHVASAA
jgi:MFS transporter, DHA2 family, glioxin efflux transporter